jgi:hypothetical protein
MPADSISPHTAKSPAKTAMRRSLNKTYTRTLQTLPGCGGIFSVWSNVSLAMTGFWRAWSRVSMEPRGCRSSRNTGTVFDVIAHIMNPGLRKVASIPLNQSKNNVQPATRSDLPFQLFLLKMRPV